MIVEITYDQMLKLLYFYNQDKTSNRNAFVKTSIREIPTLTERESCLIWAAFDMVYDRYNLSEIDLSEHIN